MCWNAEVSLNTFLFSTFALALVYYNNEYTKYKNPIFDNKWLYLFCILSFTMQLIEFFIWKNIKNKYNVIFTKLAFILVYLQPIASLMLLSNINLRNFLLTQYIIVGIPFIISIIYNNKINTTVSKQGHLVWNTNISLGGINLNTPAFIYWMILLLFSFFYEQKWIYLLFGIVTFSVFMYKEYNSAASTWCWFINIFSFYILFYLLFYLPFCEKNRLC